MVPKRRWARPISRMASTVGSALKSTPPPPFTCVSRKPGSSRWPPRSWRTARVGSARRRRRRRRRSARRRAARRGRRRCRSSTEHAAVDQRDRHQTVSVTLLKCGGRSGSQAARERERVGEPVEALDHQQRLDRPHARASVGSARAPGTSDPGQQHVRADACSARPPALRRLPVSRRAARTRVPEIPLRTSASGPWRSSAALNASACRPQVSLSLSAASCAMPRPSPRPTT